MSTVGNELKTHLHSAVCVVSYCWWTLCRRRSAVLQVSQWRPHLTGV